jgi:hypothetical protein
MSALYQKRTLGRIELISYSIISSAFGSPDGFAFLTFQKNGGAFLRLSGFCHNS